MRLRVAEIVKETPTTKTLRCERVDGPLPPWRPGQYVNVYVDVDGVLTSRPYSISCAPGDGLLDLTVRDKPGGFVAPYLLNEVQVGHDLESTGPAGNFYYEPLIDGEELVFLAGGSGITPFMSIIRDVLAGDEEDSEAPRLWMYLFYGSRKVSDVIFGRELAELAAVHSNFAFSPVISEPPPGYPGLTGFLCADLIRQRVGDVEGKTFYICGPNVMYGYCLAELAELGVPPHKIKRELYGPPDDVTLEPGWPKDLPANAVFEIEVQGRAVVRAPAGEPLLNSLERYGLVVPAVCRAGECSACRTRLLSGRVFQPSQACLRESDREQGYIHACVSYPLENLRIRI
jgi:ferredoxin-NADP reductase